MGRLPKRVKPYRGYIIYPLKKATKDDRWGVCRPQNEVVQKLSAGDIFYHFPDRFHNLAAAMNWVDKMVDLEKGWKGGDT